MFDPPPTVRPGHNAKTVLPFTRPEPDGDAIERAHEGVKRVAEMRPAAVERGFRLMWVYAGDGAHTEMGSLDLPAAAGSYAVIGRHTCSDVILAHDEQLSLRHLLATSYVLEDGGVALRLLDLQSTMPMRFDDDVPRHSIVATSPFRLRLGRYVLAGAPILPGQPIADQSLASLAPIEAVSVHELPLPPRQTLDSVPALSPLSTDADSAPISVASLPPVASVVMMVKDKPKLEPGEAHLRFEFGGRSRSIVFDQEELDRGLLVGRDPRCVGGSKEAGWAINEILPIQVSRVHLLLLRDRGRVFAFDTGSSNGTFRKGERVRRAELDADHRSLRIAGRNGIKMTLTLA